eukprot:592698-Rhodomonas_salina.1
MQYECSTSEGVPLELYPMVPPPAIVHRGLSEQGIDLRGSQEPVKACCGQGCGRTAPSGGGTAEGRRQRTLSGREAEAGETLLL